jgi:hypothetical protein
MPEAVIALRWAESVATHGTGPTRTVDIDAHVPGVAGPVPMELPLVDALDLYGMLGRALAAEYGVRLGQLAELADEQRAEARSV